MQPNYNNIDDSFLLPESDSTLNMNLLDVTDEDKELRNGKTILNPFNETGNYGVLELSTKAVKLLIGNKAQILKNPFNFDYFLRQSEKTETGKGLDADNVMNLDYYWNCVIPAIKKMLYIADNENIGILYAVATAAYRTAKNRTEIIEMIRHECGINVQILSKKEEAAATLSAFLFSCPRHISIGAAQIGLVIDQGGGSTEICLFKGNQGEILDTYSLNVGTTVQKNMLFQNINAQTSLKDAFEMNEILLKKRLTPLYNLPSLKENKIDFCVALGTAITTATHKVGNARQHGTILTLDKIKETIHNIDQILNIRYTNMLELWRDMEKRKHIRENPSLDNTVIMRIGLPFYAEIMTHLGINELVVSGTGLWYGVYFENLREEPEEIV